MQANKKHWITSWNGYLNFLCLSSVQIGKSSNFVQRVSCETVIRYLRSEQHQNMNFKVTIISSFFFYKEAKLYFSVQLLKYKGNYCKALCVNVALSLWFVTIL